MTALVRVPGITIREIFSNKFVNVALLASMIIASVICFFAINTNSDNDPRWQMIVTENLIRHQRYNVDNFSPETLKEMTYHVVPALNGRHYYYFPYGTTLVTIPVVAVLDALGWDMKRDEALAERVTCSLAAALLIFMLFVIARNFVSPLSSLALSCLMWLGTSLSSTGGLATWSHLTSTGFAILSILLVLRDPFVESKKLRFALGLALFMAYLSRPTMSILTPIMLIFIACHSWRSALWVGSIVLCCLGIFFCANLLFFKEARPFFYAGGRLGTSTYLEGVWGNLFGASRGLFIFSPFLLIPILFVRRLMHSPKRALLILALGWPILHVMIIAAFPGWWGGYSYGPRYTMEVLPGLFVLLCLAWEQCGNDRLTLPMAICLSVLGSIAAFAHGFEGMYNPATKEWNNAAKTGDDGVFTMDWHWPQWAATESRNVELAAYRAALRALPIGQHVAGACLAPSSRMTPTLTPPALSRSLTQGWAAPGPDFVWSDGYVAELDLCADAAVKVIDLDLSAYPPKPLSALHVTFSLDGKTVEEADFTVQNSRQNIRIPLPSEHARSLKIKLDIPDAVSPKSIGESDDPRILGVRLYGITSE